MYRVFACIPVASTMDLILKPGRLIAVKSSRSISEKNIYAYYHPYNKSIKAGVRFRYFPQENKHHTKRWEVYGRSPFHLLCCFIEHIYQ